MGGIAALFSEHPASDIDAETAEAQAATPYRGSMYRTTCAGSSIGIQSRLDESTLLENADSILALNGYISRLPLSTDTAGRPVAAAKAALDAGSYSHLQQLDGEFSLVYRNKRTGECGFYCSPSATRPLFFATSKNRLSVCTEIRQALRLAKIAPTPNRHAIAQHLAFGHQVLDLEQTIYESARRASSGTLYLFDVAGRNLRRIPFPHPPSLDDRIREQDAGALLLHNVRDAVHACMRKEATGLALSGGLDSGLILACLQQRKKPTPWGTLIPYSIRFPGWEMDETPWITETLRQLGINGRYLDGTARPPSHYFEKLVANLDHSPAVLTDSYIDMLSPMMRADGCRYRMSGFAGDFTLGFGQSYLADYFRHGRPLRALADATLFQNTDPFSVSNALRNIYRQVLFPECTRWRKRPRRPAWLHADQAGIFDASLDRQCAYVREFGLALGPRMQLLAILRSGAWSDLVEQRCAQWELETLNPLSQQRIVDVTFRIPPHWLDGGTHNRSLVRKASRGLLPETARKYRGKVLHNRYATGDIELLRFAGRAHEWRLARERIVDPGPVQQLLTDSQHTGTVSVLLGRMLRMEHLLKRLA